jgi:putative transposase
MPRKPRWDEAGGRYHVLNRGNYRQWLFAEDTAKEAFERTLFEACGRAGWVLHAFCIMGNHYHLALETPEGNLSEGMRWLQSTFAARFNRFRRESGHLFQGRFKSLAVEDDERLAWLCHYIHLNPVRAAICSVESLRGYRGSSYWYLHEKRRRPACLDLRTCLEGAGGLRDEPAGRRSYGDYLRWLQEDDATRKTMEFDRMSRGWAIGSRGFRREMAQEDRKKGAMAKLTHAEAREAREERAEAMVERCLEALGRKETDAAREPKSADWKVGVATFMKQRMLATNPWLAERLHMGTAAGVSRYTAETLAGRRPGAERCRERLTAKIKE